MDSFTQRMIEKAQQRNRALGLSSVVSTEAETPTTTTRTNVDKVPQTTTRSAVSPDFKTGSGMNKLQVVEKTAPLDAGISKTNKVLRQFSAVDKENMELGIEINIVSSKQLEVQVEVEEQDMSDNENDEGAAHAPSRDIVDQPLARIRETSRNRLQRLGALYSNTDDLSSPIHRTEAQFHADTVDESNSELIARKPKPKYGKLAALANTINQWEDDSSLHVTPRKLVPPPKPDLPSRKRSTMATQSRTSGVQESSKTSTVASNISVRTKSTVAETTEAKKLNWDPKVINSLEAQGFQRRESSTTKLAYDYARNRETNDEPLCNSALTAANNSASEPILSGLVSGRAAVFEQKSCISQQPQRVQKDPTELSLKERMQLFERNKGEALLPKAALGMAPSINQIRQDSVKSKEEIKAQTSHSVATTTTAILKTNADSKVRDKVAALVSNATTISENKIRAEIRKQRDEDMQVLANRFNRQKGVSMQEPEQQVDTTAKAKTTQDAAKAKRTGMPPPPQPPQANLHVGKTNSPSCTKRRSPGDAIDDDELKRARKSPGQITGNRLYPALSDLESNGSQSDNENGGTTANVSPINTPRAGVDEADEYDEDNDSYMSSEMATGDGDNDSSAEICNGSLGRDVMKAVVQCNNYRRRQYQPQQQKQRKEVRYAEKNSYFEHCGDSSINSSEGSMCVDDCIDEALDVDFNYTQSDDSDAGNTSHVSKGSHGTTASNSFSFRKTPHKFSTYRTISEEQADDGDSSYPIEKVHSADSEEPITSNLTLNKNNDNMVTLVHTVSFYRRQQNANSANNTPVRKIYREEKVTRNTLKDSSTETSHSCIKSGADSYNSSESYNEQEQLQSSHENHWDDVCDPNIDSDLSEQLVQEKIKKLLDEVCKQQQIIAQTSQALNLCAATVEFSGSTESVEGERHLLVATHRRQACLDEVQRLRVEKSLRPHGAPKERGRLTVKEITVPLRQDYIRKLAADTISGHHLVCLLKYNEHVLATRTVPTLPGLLAVKFPDVLQLSNVYADFKVTLEVYGMTAQREVLPHEVKYHINLNKKSGIKTPKKKGSENILVMPPVQSPAGPNVVRTPALVQYGFAIFSLREIQRTTWSLTQVLGLSPLAGIIHMKVQCELSVSVENKGFLTMYEDISGLGAWHRRWCHLNGSTLNYWKYPDDERKKTPIGSIDLYSCITPKVALAQRDICARLHTILLECQRPAKDTDKESLTIVPNGDVTIVRYLLSADTKDEREEWCAVFNKSLSLLRAWGPPH